MIHSTSVTRPRPPVDLAGPARNGGRRPAALSSAGAFPLSLALPLALAGCAFAEAIPRSSGGTSDSSTAAPHITVLAPSIEFIDIRTDSLIPSSTMGGDTLSDFVIRIACEALDRPGLVCASGMDPIDQGDPEELRRFVAGSSRTVAAQEATGWSDLLTRIAAGDSARCVVVHHIRVKIGPGGYWNPLNGAIAHDASSTYVRVALVECRTGRVLRKSEAFLRERPNPRHKKFVQALRSTYLQLR